MDYLIMIGKYSVFAISCAMVSVGAITGNERLITIFYPLMIASVSFWVGTKM